MSQEEFAPGYIKYNDPDNSPNVQVYGDDGKFHRAQLVAIAGISGGGSVDENKIIIKSDTIPEASEENFHKFYCYSGVTNSRYTHGYVYECVESNPTEEGTIGYAWERIDLQPTEKIGRYLSNWNAITGLPTTNPQKNPYEYTTGDYYIVSNVSAGPNYKPSGSSYVIGEASTVVETSQLSVGDIYLYDGTAWILLKTGGSVTSVNGKTGEVVLSAEDVGAATAAQGAKADSAVQTIEEGTANGTISVDGTDVEVHGLGSAAFTDSSDYATAAQGAKADSALQSGDNVSELINDADYASTTFREWNEGE